MPGKGIIKLPILVYGHVSFQAYVRQHNIQQLVKDAIVSLCIHKPDNPVLFLRDHFDRLAAEQQRQQFSQVIKTN